MKKMLLWTLLLSVSGCATHVRLHNAERLVKHPQFPAAARAAPEFTRDALKTINELEFQLESK